MRRFFVAACLLSLSGNISVSGADVDVWKEKLTTSQKTWETVRKTCRGNYSYQVTRDFYSGTSQTTTVVVRDNKVIERRFEKGSASKPLPPGAKPAKTVVEWIETAADLGKHEGPAAKPKTMDELYADASKVLSEPIAKYEQLTVSFDKEGLLKDCFTIDTRIADDTPRKGVAIVNLKLGKE